MPSAIPLLRGALLGLSLALAAAVPGLAAPAVAPQAPAPLSGSAGALLLAQLDDIDFGDDSGEWANDGECDDPRFTGPGTAAELVDADLMKDATDCREAYEAGTVTLAEDGGGESGKETATGAADVDFGDDTSDWANDGECDDPRFTGTGMAAELLPEDEGHDATDCREAFEAGTVTVAGENGDETATGAADIDFGDDTSDWANDGECDDPRFTGTGMAAELLPVDEGHDATDCRTLYEDGSITLKGEAASTGDIDFGDDESPWANDGECDDPRFTGPGTAAELLDSDEGHDATDCREAFEAGTVTLADAGSDAPTVFDYGDDTSQWANDGECDDPRFAGPGTSKKLLTEDEMRDASDCRALVESGEAEIRKVYDPAYAAAGPYDGSHIDFGDDSSTYANDGECDDPRFEGPGTAATLLDSDELRDATDCREAYEAGTIMLVGE